MNQTAAADLMASYAALPEPYQPAWGLEASRDMARRACDDRLRVLLPLLGSLPCQGTLRILDVGCAQGYFTLAIAHAMGAQGRNVEITGVDNLEANVRFCQALAAHHGIAAKFVHASFDAGFFDTRGMQGYDAVLALNVLHHVQNQQDADAVVGVVGVLRTHARTVFCELAQREESLDWVGAWHASDDELLGGYAFRRRLAQFPTHLGDVPRPLYVCSDTLAWVGDRWFAFDAVSARSHPGVPESFAGQRRYFVGREAVVKAFRGDGRYGPFNRTEIEFEVAVLTALSDEPDRFPEVLGQSDDGDMVWLARGVLPGRLLSACIDGGESFDRDAVVRSLLEELAHLESRGYHHGDLRCWNVLLDCDAVRLIDFGAMTDKPAPLQRVALAAMLREIADGKLRHAQPYYASLQPLNAYPTTWWPMLRSLLETLQVTFHYSQALSAFGNADAESGKKAGTHPLAPTAEIIEAVAHEQSEGFKRLQEHDADVERRLVTSERALADAAAEREVVLASQLDAEAYAASLDARLERETASAAAEREAVLASQRDAEAYAASLDARLELETANAAAEREAALASRRDAAAHAASLAHALSESQRYASSLRKALDESQAHADSLHEQLARMRQRFRWLKSLWPRESKAPKEPE